MADQISVPCGQLGTPSILVSTALLITRKTTEYMRAVSAVTRGMRYRAMHAGKSWP